MILWESDIQNSIVFTPVEIRSKKGRKTMKKAKTAIYIPNMEADTFEKICQEKGLQFVYVEVPERGDSIDYSFCMENYELLHEDDGNPVYAVRMRDINEAPTIIPANPVKEGEG